MGCIGCTGCSSSAAWSLTGSSAPAAFPVIQLQGFKAEKTRKGMGVKDTSGEGRGDLSRQETGMRLRRDKRRLVARRTAWLGELIVTRSCHRAMSSDRVEENTNRGLGHFYREVWAKELSGFTSPQMTIHCCHDLL
ncbi:hypothetical protein GW17_00062236 [Ensete ventricosum]|nr:hypothetical protein GW17_00062236 [Ensete ventricosum]